MVKKNLKHALRAHEEAKKKASKLQAAQEAAKRKALSIKFGKQPKRQRKENEQHQKEVHVRPFEKHDTILLVGEGERYEMNGDLLVVCTLTSRGIQATSPSLARFCYPPTIMTLTCS